jgi:ribosomal protein S18 acetylase RimI-like enzyme
MTNPRRVRLPYAQAGRAVAALAAWTTATDPPSLLLHPGDLGWALRFEDTIIDLWLDGETPVAVGMDDGGEYRFAGALDLPATETEPWVHLYQPLSPVAGNHPDLSEADIADRVAVQRAAFEKSTFTVARWQAMRASPAGHLCVEVLVRTPDGEAASAVTGWLAGQGKCALIEPMGTHPAHRGKGYGREALRRVGDALAARGASAVCVFTPASNTAAVALYRSVGYTVIGELRHSFRLGEDAL